MAHFTPKQISFQPFFNNKMKEMEKINKLIDILEDSGVGSIIETNIDLCKWMVIRILTIG